MSNGLPVITHIINGFDIIISAIAEINQVMVFPMGHVDRETASFPLTAIYESPQSVESRNRLEHNTTIIHIETIFIRTDSKENLYLQGKLYESLIHKAIYTELNTGSLITPYIENIRKNPPDYNFPDDETVIIVQEYIIEYLHKYGDPFTKENY